MGQTGEPSATGGKRLALFLDGTWNTVSSNTNVWRLKSMCARTGSDGAPQLVYYNKGLGTSMGEIIRGGVFGYRPCNLIDWAARKGVDVAMLYGPVIADAPNDAVPV